MLKLKKRGQITIFIILGIIVLMTSAAYFYVREQTTVFLPENLPSEKSTEIHKFAESCLEMKTRDALNIVGATGGYIEYPFLIENDPAAYLKVSPIPEAKMPYWWYAGQNRIPDLETYIKPQVEKYIEQHIDECINNFSDIKSYEVFKTGDVDVIITFAAKDVAVEMKYPLRAVKLPQRNEFELNNYDFFIRLPIRFAEVYHVAEKIMNDENQAYFLEHWTVDLISLADSPNTEYTTPLSNVDFTFKPYIWTVREVKENLQALISADIQYIKFKGTDYVPYPASDDFTYMRNHYLWSFDQNPHENIHVSLTYDERWPFRISVSPTKGGEILKSGTTQYGDVLSFVGIQTWHFTYDVVYPVLVTIRDEEGKNNDDYSFSYTFLVSVQKNKPFRQNFASDVFTTQDSASTEETCNYLKQSFNVPITIRTFDDFTNEGIRNVNLTFTCGRYTCPIGKTDWTDHGASGSLFTKNFPYCTWGILRGYKEGYEDIQMFMSSNEEKTVDLYLRPVKEFTNYTMIKRFYVPDNNVNKVGSEAELDDNESAVIIIRAKNMTDQFISYPQENPTPIKLYKDIDYTYNVTIYLFDEEEDALIGAYDGFLIPSVQEVKDSDSIEFQTLEYRASDEEKLGFFLLGIKEYSKDIPSPTLKKG